MKLSVYNVKVPLDDNKMMIYNTLSRKYISYKSENIEFIDNLLKNLNKGEYTYEEIDCIKKLMSKGMIIKDNIDELDIIQFRENDARFQDKTFYLVILPTMDCNFRCVYCFEDHKQVGMDDVTANSLIKYIDNISKKVRLLHINWFGGEPLLELQRIENITKQIKEVCEKNSCIYDSSMVTNGYLMDDEVIDKLKGLNVSVVQITLDGNEEYHNKKRPLENGEGTFQRIKENIIKLSYKEGIRINLRINVDEENISHVNDLFDIIPEQNKKNISVQICNIFQNKNKINLYDTYMIAINKGYTYYNRQNSYSVCEVCKKNGLSIEPNGKVAACAVTAEDGHYIGFINENGRFVINNESFYYKIKGISAMKSEKCRKCIKLPICMGGCKYARYSDNNVCNGDAPDNMSVSDKARLHYYSDLKQNNIKEADII